MPERTPIFEEYLKSLEKTKKTSTKKGAAAREGKLSAALEEPLDAAETETESFAGEKLNEE